MIDKAAAADDLKKLFGLAPYNVPSNTSQGDSYFGASLVSKYGKTIDELCKLTGVHPT